MLCACAMSATAFAHTMRPQGPPPPSQGQSGRPAPPQASLLRIFLDCNRCDGEYLREQITFVDYMRDRADADVHVLVTTEDTGGGGTSWTVKLIGLNAFAGHEHVITFTTPQTATGDDQRKEMARILKIGLVAYASGTPAITSLNVTYTKPAESATAKKKDPWNYWVFRLNANGNLNGEESSSNKSFNFNGNASRTTENWKLALSGNRRESRNSYDLGDGEIFKSRTSSWSSDLLVVKSAGPRFSLGMRGNASGSTFSNQDLVSNLLPTAEYNIFPYKENARRSFTLSYGAGVQIANYTAETIYDKLSETIPRHRLGMGLSLRQPWGSIESSVNFTQQLNKLDRTNLGFFGEADVRLFKGFSFNVFGDYSRIRDQISLQKGDASTEDVLLRLRQLHSGYSYFMGFGVSYSFGSIFNTVVNPRFGG
jgi:hypothetical protein